jgi:hypothetical protein
MLVKEHAMRITDKRSDAEFEKAGLVVGKHVVIEKGASKGVHGSLEAIQAGYAYVRDSKSGREVIASMSEIAIAPSYLGK